MEFHKGRLIDHVHLRVSDLDAGKRFYKAALTALGFSELLEGDHFLAADELWIDEADNGPVSRVHLAFQAPSREHVVAFHAAALKAGGRDNGLPGERAWYPRYFAACVLDPDGHNIEAVHHGPVERSVTSVVFRPTAL